MIAHLLGIPVWHDCHTDFPEMLRRALRNEPIAAAHGPIYVDDPAAEIMLPFVRSCHESGWRNLNERDLAPRWVLERANAIRSMAIPTDGITCDEIEDVVRWTRAGLVHEISSIRGINLVGRGVVHPRWRLRGTVTGRFGCVPVRGDGWTFNPLSLGSPDRARVRPSDAVREIAVLDFRAMDLCSMFSIVPGLRERYGSCDDPHSMTARIITGEIDLESNVRSLIKEQLFVHSYGGESVLRAEFDSRLPELGWLRNMPPGEGARLVQSRSAMIFRAALSEALPLLVGDHIIPMFTVHDEVVVDCSDIGLGMVRSQLVPALERGAALASGGITYRVGLSVGYTYAEAKGDQRGS